jgi:predicted GNAT family acetyltransferase
MPSPPPSVERNADARRFEVAGEPSAYLKYFEGEGRIRLVHTEVPTPLEGRGYGSALVRAALDYARGAHLRVDPLCPFVREYVARHPEYADMVNPIAPGASST